MKVTSSGAFGAVTKDDEESGIGTDTARAGVTDKTAILPDFATGSAMLSQSLFASLYWLSHTCPI